MAASSGVLIIGAGIGGLTTAIALRQRGIEAHVYEQAPELRPLGAGLSLWPNAVSCLQRLGLAEPLLAQGRVVERLQLLTDRGTLLAEMPNQLISARAGAPGICVHRGDLQQTLLKALPADAVHLGAKLTHFEQNEQRVVTSFEDGSAARGKLLIGADGLRSTVRAQLLGAEPPRYAGYGGWLGVAPREVSSIPPGLAFEAWGCGERMGGFPCGGGRTYWFFCHNRREPLAQVTPGGKTELQRHVADWFAPCQELVEATDNDAMVALSFFDRPPAKRWGTGRATLLGDAAHPMTPNLGQGACQAIEDALTLAFVLENNRDPAAALRDYERRRMPRTAKLVRQARQLGRLAQLASPWACTLRNAVVQKTPTAITLARLTWQMTTPAELRQ